MICKICQVRESVKSSVIRDQYYPALCKSCYEALIAGQEVSSGHADWERGRDFEEHEAYAMQPVNPDGTASREFMRLYPDTAKKVFSQDEIDQAMRS